MAKFIVSTDSTADLYADYVRAHDVRLAPLSFTMEKDGVVREYLDAFTDYAQYLDFYAQLRDKVSARTSMLNYDAHYTHFEKIAREGGTDVLHFTISSGLASTIHVARRAAEDVKKEYPSFNLKAVDSLAATIGQGELVYEAVRRRDAGDTLDEAYAAVTDLPLHFQYVIAANDLFYLQRGGRVSAAAAIVGSALGVKPILSFTQDGKLSVIDKVRGMKRVFAYALDKMERLRPVEEGRVIHVVHTDAEKDANDLADMIEARWKTRPEVSVIGPVIGAHVGPGAVAVLWKSRELRCD
ncbi:MAG TPA: DegV family protein [Candidatus Borkfalkia faecigallinarum]|uniref:DegV family protein n=1 Tax=Candidatus Borkfalkia faecigallinarum TaxID=2838509 RepID=A0A9D1VUP2_9FIRM|nr:DegV family protein [Candidatus Borkfalkia faecigallinarum]